MHVTFVVRSMSRGGIARQVSYLASGLSRRGHRVSIVQFFATSSNDELVEADIEPETLDVRGRRDVARLVWRFGERLRSLRPDVVYGFYVESNLLALLGGRAVGAKVVWGIRTDNLGSLESEAVGRVTAMVHARLLRRPDLVVANSDAGGRAVLAAGLPESRVRVILNGVDTSRFAPGRSARERVRREWNVANGATLVGAVGRLEPRKGLDRFLRAAAVHAERESESRYVLVGPGDGSEERRLAALAQELGIADRIVWAGPRADMPAVYESLDLTTLLSVGQEGCPNVVAESLACGVPCVVADVGDAPALVADPSAVVVPDDAEAVADAWVLALDRWTPDAAAAARRRMESRLGLARLVDDTEQALLGLL